MDLGLHNKTILVTGASSGLGRAVVEMLLNENAMVLAFARNINKLDDLKLANPNKLTLIQGDILNDSDLKLLIKTALEHNIDGLFINAGGPPAKSTLDTNMDDWDNGYQLLVRWKIELILQLIPHLKSKSSARIILNESISVKQPIPNLVLSNSLRLAMVGFAKTLASEMAEYGTTINVIAPGYHDTDALTRIFKKKSEALNISMDEAKQQIINSIPTKYLGNTDNYASLVCWLFSHYSGYITGQTISIEGGVMQGIF
jgi:3-oxoacyl-[acyl-carrier protein] reductase